MKIILISALVITLTLAQTRLDFNSNQCNTYLGKFGTALNADGTGATKLAMRGEVSFVKDSSDVTVSIRYSDDDFYNDTTYFGMVQEDGKTQAATCLDLRVYKYADSTYTNGVVVTAPGIKSDSSFQKKWRYYNFPIAGTDLSTKTTVTENSNQYIYTGYYSFSFYAAGTQQVQYTFYFQFSVTVSKSTSAVVDTVFKPLSQKETAGCAVGASCTVAAQSSLSWCSEPTCSVLLTTAPNLYLNDQFVLLHQITTAGMKKYFLTGSTILYTGSGLNKAATVVSSNYTIAGQAIYVLKANIAWTAVKISVTSSLSTTAPTARRLLVEDTVDTLTAEVSMTDCIKVKETNACPTCQEQCDTNGFALSSCPQCDGTTNGQLLMVIFVILALLF